MAESTHQADAAKGHHGVPEAYINKLTPPPGTNYWRHQSFTLMKDQQFIYYPEDPITMKFIVQTLTWNIDAYVYAVDAQPGDNFAGRGGSVYVVLVHTGSAATGSLVGPGLEYRYNVTLKSPPDGSSAVKKLPPSNSGSHNGDTWNYPISFAQDMQMFSNGGSQLTTFPAQYEDSVDLNNGQQTGFVNGSSGTQWGIRFDVAPEFHQNFPFASLCLWKVESLTQINFDCEASVIIDDKIVSSATRNITVDCHFTPVV